MTPLDEVRSCLETTDVSMEDCMKRLHEVRSWLARNTPEQEQLQATDVIDLYNASRNCAMHDSSKAFAYQVRALSCILLKQAVGPSLSESLDVLRCFSRTGHALVGTSAESHIIASPEDCFSEAIAIYRTIGLNHLSKTRSGVELEEVCDDIWDAFEGHLTCIDSLDNMVQDIHDLKMFMPYLPQNATKFVKLVMNLAEDQHKLNASEGEATLLGIALESIETLDHVKKKQTYRRSILARLVDVFIDMERLEKAETCWRMLMALETPHGLLSGVKLHLKMKSFPRALSLVEELQEQDNFGFACEATRMYSNTLGYSDTTVLTLWETLKVNFPDNDVQVDMELATDMAFSDIQALREKSFSIVASLAEQCTRLTPDQISQLKKIMHDASCNARNYGLNEELFRWTEAALLVSSTPSERVVCKRILSGAKLLLGDIKVAMQYATEALGEEMSKKSLFTCFRVLMQDTSSNKSSLDEVLVQLIACDDFDVYDLIAFGREAHQANNQSTVLHVCETLAKLLSERIFTTSEIPQLEVGVLYQNMAQLNNSLSEGDESKRLAKFMSYLDELLAIAEKIEPSQVEKSFGPPEVLEWFFGVCHNIGVNTQNWTCFKQAAQVALAATKLFPTTVTKLHGRDGNCWVAAICLRMKDMDTLSRDDLLELESILEKQLSHGSANNSKIQDYLATSHFVVKIQTDGYRRKDFLDCYKAKVEQTSTKYRELGDYVFVTSKHSTNETSTVALRSIASQLYKQSYENIMQSDFRGNGLVDRLQLGLHQKHVESRSVAYALKKLVALSQSKEEGSEWLEQVVQICTTIDVVLVDDDIEWFMAKAWNFGVSCFRSHERDAAKEFMAMALRILGMSKSHTLVKAHQDNLDRQYAHLLAIMHEHNQS